MENKPCKSQDSVQLDEFELWCRNVIRHFTELLWMILFFFWLVVGMPVAALCYFILFPLWMVSVVCWPVSYLMGVHEESQWPVIMLVFGAVVLVGVFIGWGFVNDRWIGPMKNRIVTSMGNPFFVLAVIICLPIYLIFGALIGIRTGWHNAVEDIKTVVAENQQQRKT